MESYFGRFARQQRIEDSVLREAVRRADAGLIDADLGGGVIKQRIARAGASRRGGFRSIVLLRPGERPIFIYGFAKSARASLGRDELAAFPRLAGEMLGYGDAAIARALASGALFEVRGNDEDLS